MKKKTILTITALIVMCILSLASCDSPIVENLANLIADAAADDPDAAADLLATTNQSVQPLTAQQQLATDLQAVRGDQPATVALLLKTATDQLKSIPAKDLKLAANLAKITSDPATLLIADLAQYVASGNESKIVKIILTATADQPALIANLIDAARTASNPPLAALAIFDALVEVRRKVAADPNANVLSLEGEAVATMQLMPDTGALDAATTTTAIQDLATRIGELEPLVIAASNENNPVAVDPSIATAKNALAAEIVHVETIAFGSPYDSTEDQSQNLSNLKVQSAAASALTARGIGIGQGGVQSVSSLVGKVTAQILGDQSGNIGTNTGIAHKVDRAIAAATALIILQS